MERHGKLMALIVATYDPDCLPEKYINCTWWPEDEEHPSDYAWRTRDRHTRRWLGDADASAYGMCMDQSVGAVASAFIR